MTSRGSGSASSSAVESKERARVPGFTFVRSARRCNLSARSSSSTTFTRADGLVIGVTIHDVTRRVHLGQLPVDLAAVGDSDDQDQQPIVVDPVQHPVVANAEAPDPSLAR